MYIILQMSVVNSLDIQSGAISQILGTMLACLLTTDNITSVKISALKPIHKTTVVYLRIELGSRPLYMMQLKKSGIH